MIICVCIHVLYCIEIYTQNARILNLVEPTSRHQL